jgi:hypothetical protein
MLSAPPVLVEPKVMIVDELSPHIEHRCFEWVTETPEPSPMYLARMPVNPVDEHLGSFTNSCTPIWEEMFTRIATHADILGASESSARKQLIQTLCQPFFDHVIETLNDEISSLGSKASAPLQKTANLEQLRFFEEDSTDAETDSAFATLFSSDGEDDCEADASLEHASQSSGGVVASDGGESPRDDEKTQMVCRHWKSKGWCRYESQCKFLHPQNKCGVSAKVMAEESDMSLANRSTRRRGGKSKRSVVALDSRLNLVDSYSYSMCPSFAIFQGM